MDVNETPQTSPTEALSPEAPDGIGAWLAKNSLPLLFVAGLLGVLVWKGFNLFDVAVAGFGLGVIIFIHELGHFAAAKWCDVHVETFSIGFGPPLPGEQSQLKPGELVGGELPAVAEAVEQGRRGGPVGRAHQKLEVAE